MAIERGIPLARTDGSRHSKQEFSAFLQAWLFFGLLQSVFWAAGLKVNYRDFIYIDRSGNIMVTTSDLPYYLSKWQHKCQRLPSASYRYMDTCLGLASTAAQILFSWRPRPINSTDCFENRVPQPQYYGSSDFVVPEIVLSIFLLGEILATCRDQMPDRMKKRLDEQTRKQMIHLGLVPKNTSDPETTSSRASPERYEEFSNPFSRPSFATFDMMLAKGWCISDATILHFSGLGSRALYFMGQLDRHGSEVDHTSCNEFSCAVHNIKDTYVTKHTETCEDENCCLISVDSSKVSSFLMDDKIPVVQIVSNNNGEIKLEVSERSGNQYLTISHVWAHGLGNTKENSLRKCQLLRLRRLMKNAWDKKSGETSPHVVDLSFWLDTLCVPVQDHLKPARSRAIKLMKETYSDSFATLVLDKELMQTSIETSGVELISRILMSAWMRRLWTLQEGLLSGDKLIFQCMGICVRYEDLLREPEDKGGTWRLRYLKEFQNSLSNCLYGSIPSVWHLGRYSDLHSLNTLALGLSPRSTSKPSDEWTCLASVLELDTSKVDTASYDERPYIFYSMLGDKSSVVSDILGNSGIPPSILVMNAQRLSRPGFRWAPKSFLNRRPSRTFDVRFGRIRSTFSTSTSDIVADHCAFIGLFAKETNQTEEIEPAYCDGDGLHTKLEGWLLNHSGEGPINSPFAFVDKINSSVYVVKSTGVHLSGIVMEGEAIALLRHRTFEPMAFLAAIPALTAVQAADRSSTLEHRARYLWPVHLTEMSMESYTQEELEKPKPGWGSSYSGSQMTLKNWCID